MTKDLADTLRKAVDKSGRTLMDLSEKSGVPLSSLSEFMSGQDMRLKNASKLAHVLKLELKPKSKRPRGGKT